MNLNVEEEGDETKFHIDQAMLQQLQNSPGLKPVIIKMQPLTDLRMFLEGG